MFGQFKYYYYFCTVKLNKQLTDNKKDMTKIKENKTMNEAVSIHHNKDGEIDGVKIQTLDECFIIALHDLDEGKNDFSHDSAMKRLEELNLKTFSKKQATILCAYLDEVNEKLKEAGGEPLAKNIYVTSSSADYYGDYSWFFHGSHGCLHYTHRINGNFRCRPIHSVIEN